MRQQDMFNSASQPFEAWTQMWFGAFGNTQKTLEPAAKSMATAQSEMMTFASRRTKAWADLPNQLAQCKAPQDFARTNAQFWQEASADWTDASQRMMTVWSAVLQNGNGFSALARDHLMVPESDNRRTEATGRTSERNNDPNGRRAAA